VIKVLLIGAGLAAVLSAPGGCTRRTDVHAIVCVSTVKTKQAQTYLRLADADCESGQAKARWRYYNANTDVPAVGREAPGAVGTWDEPSGSLVHIPVKGGNAREEFDK
jgi:hypothetical protein